MIFDELVRCEPYTTVISPEKVPPEFLYVFVSQSWHFKDRGLIGKEATKGGVDQGEFSSFGNMGVFPVANLFVDFFFNVYPECLRIWITLRRTPK